jgi:ABC-type arginine/histidine transport system permease subunit
MAQDKKQTAEHLLWWSWANQWGSSILSLNMNEGKYAATFSTAIRIIPVRLRGLMPIPEV